MINQHGITNLDDNILHEIKKYSKKLLQWKSVLAQPNV